MVVITNQNIESSKQVSNQNCRRLISVYNHAKINSPFPQQQQQKNNTEIDFLLFYKLLDTITLTRWFIVCILHKFGWAELTLSY